MSWKFNLRSEKLIWIHKRPSRQLTKPSKHVSNNRSPNKQNPHALSTHTKNTHFSSFSQSTHVANNPRISVDIWRCVYACMCLPSMHWRTHLHKNRVITFSRKPKCNRSAERQNTNNNLVTFSHHLHTPASWRLVSFDLRKGLGRPILEWWGKG